MSDTRCGVCQRPLPLLRGIYAASCKRRDCSSYAPTWAKDQYVRLLANLGAYGGRAAMTTLTAPGFAVIPEGEPQAAAAWNRTAMARWSKLNRRAKSRADRRTNFKGGVLGYSRELQKRGVWHWHIALPMETGIERAWSHQYVQALAELGPASMFGYVDRKPLRSPREGAAAGRYMAKYLAKADGESLAERLQMAGSEQLVYVPRRLTAVTGVTMRALRLLRRAYRELQEPAKVLWPMSESDRAVVARCLLGRQLMPVRGP